MGTARRSAEARSSDRIRSKHLIESDQKQNQNWKCLKESFLQFGTVVSLMPLSKLEQALFWVLSSQWCFTKRSFGQSHLASALDLASAIPTANTRCNNQI